MPKFPFSVQEVVDAYFVHEVKRIGYGELNGVDLFLALFGNFLSLNFVLESFVLYCFFSSVVAQGHVLKCIFDV